MLQRTPLAIETDRLTRRYGHLLAVDHVDLRIAAGTLSGLLGPNGAGKTTLVKMLITLLRPSEGTARVAGHDIRIEPAAVRRHVGYVPQMVSADGALSARENLVLSAKLYGLGRAERKRRIDEALDFMGLREAAGKLVRTYSGGMIRRLELAQAMLHRPSVLFLDEPTIGLDPVARHLVWDRLRELRQDLGITVLLTTHDMEEADRLCDELAILHMGAIGAIGAPAALKARTGPDATLEDVFVHFSGTSLREGGDYGEVRQTRSTARRLG